MADKIIYQRNVRFINLNNNKLVDIYSKHIKNFKYKIIDYQESSQTYQEVLNTEREYNNTKYFKVCQTLAYEPNILSLCIIILLTIFL